jgi:putative ABC transport system ATP-binding protein
MQRALGPSGPPPKVARAGSTAPEPERPAAEQQEREAMSALLEAVDLHRSFGATPALRGVDVTVAEGEILAVMGPSGSGKSTLLHCLAGILRPDRGEVRYAGRRIDDLSEHDRTELRRRSFGFLFQFGQLVPELSAVENVALPLLLCGRRRSDALAAADGWFDRLDIGGLQARRPGELSGGEAQRVALGRALVTSPPVLFADEPTGSLDSLSGERVMNLLVDTARAGGTTVVLVTHEPRVAAYSDREIVVHDGRAAVPAAAR